MLVCMIVQMYRMQLSEDSMADDNEDALLTSTTKNITHCTNQEAFAERTQEANFIHRACLEPLFD